MRITTDNLTALQEALADLVELAGEIEGDIDVWLDAREDSTADRDAVADARATIEGALPDLADRARNLLALVA